MKYFKLIVGFHCLILLAFCNQKKPVPHSVERKSLYNMISTDNQSSEIGFLVIVNRDIVEHKTPIEIASFITQNLMPSHINWEIADGHNLSDLFELDIGDEHLPCYYFPVKLSNNGSIDIIKYCEEKKDNDKQSDFSKHKFLLINNRSIHFLYP